ncbi:hypothetical protein CCH79_00016550 [Gambusia affinis]|uniref:Telomeric single stranded DNA binding POT1/Cdc13 domain-containing protein n=1 Tax=Gambusia affinis TaxID=33528 RepID=A0A315V965_GAMAF|nr:hypothetical protein CCH79_00016550 [Gambusia affinis]
MVCRSSSSNWKLLLDVRGSIPPPTVPLNVTTENPNVLTNLGWQQGWQGSQLGWQLPPHATPVDPPLDSSLLSPASLCTYLSLFGFFVRMRIGGISCLFETRRGKAVISCRRHHNIMIVYVMSERSGPGSQVPSHLTRIPMPLLCPNTNHNNKTVKGEVIHKGPLVRAATGDWILKTIIHEEDAIQRMSMNMIIFGALAESFSHRVNPGPAKDPCYIHRDVLWVSGFSVGKSPTSNKDKLHPCNLLLSGEDACIYVFKQRPPEPRSPLASRGCSLTPAEDLRTPRAPRYTYVRLNELKYMAVVNVYGVVVFFKQPFKSRGTDYCSSLKITDQTERKIGCTIFCENLEDHPRIFQTGDIVRMHRVKPGAFLKIYNLRAVPGPSRVPGLTSSQPVEPDHLAFYLHGGTSHGRGIRLLPENSPDVQKLRRVIQAFLDHQDEEVSELNDSELLEVWSTPPEFIDGEVVDCRTERCCDHQLQLVTLSQVKQSAGGQTHHVRAQIGSYEPSQLHRALKLFCCSCSAIEGSSSVCDRGILDPSEPSRISTHDVDMWTYEHEDR